MKHFISGLIIGLLIVPAAAYIYLVSGMAPVAVDAKAMPFERGLAMAALHKRLDQEAPKNAGVDAGEPNLQKGAEEYMEHCAICHGTLTEDSSMHSAMFPRPPALVKGKGVTDDPVGETYWVIANGIRLSGMPEFKSHFSEQELWQISQMLANADKLPPSVQQILQKPMPEHLTGETNQQVEQKEHNEHNEQEHRH